jgi:FkbM family methyltransferase
VTIFFLWDKNNDMFKEIIKQVFAFFDYELRKRSRYFVDAFQDQKKLLERQNVQLIFDCGANIGQTTAKYRQLFPNATIYSFEPTQKTFNILSETFQDSASVKPQQLALSNINGHQQFTVYKESVLNSFFSIEQEADKYLLPQHCEKIETVDITTITIDEFCAKNKIDKIDILKMDIQGGELLALQGAVSLLNQQAINLIYLEINFAKLYQDQSNFHEINKFLEEYDYFCYGIYNLYRGFDGSLGFADAIFISREIKRQLPQFLTAPS